MKFALATLLCFILGALAIIFPNGQMPHQLQLANGETAIAYTDGTVYTNTQHNKRTLSLNESGQLMSSCSLMGPGFLSYHEIRMPASAQETNEWNEVQIKMSQGVSK